MQKIWNVKAQNPLAQKELANSLNISPILSQLLINRGLSAPKEAYEFLRCDLESLADPYLLKDMDVACARIGKAISRNEKIAIYADYDVDGLTGCAILMKAVTDLGARDPIYYIPNRLQEGYGLNSQAIKRLGEQNVSLLISVDCGIGDHAAAEYTRHLGLDLIIIDHHQPLTKLPEALAIVNPKRSDSAYPYRELSGVGCAFRVVQALTGRQMLEWLDLVALGTVADVAPMTGENRILTKHGLSRLNETTSLGLKALMDVAGVAGRPLATQDIGYILGPRINAAGRLGAADEALKLLLTSSREEADFLAKALDQINSERQRIQRQTLEEAVAKVEREVNFRDHRAIVIWDEAWHLGVIGIVASKVVERYYRPTIIFSVREGKGRGSGRSIENFHLFEALERCQELLERYGGHKKAVGLTIDEDRLNHFREAINSIASEVLTPQDLVPKVEIDLEVPLSGLATELMAEIESLGPFGSGNPRPIFSTRDLTLRTKPDVTGKDRLRMWVTDQKVTYEAVWRRTTRTLPSGLAARPIHLAYSPAAYFWRGQPQIRLELVDAKVG